MQIVVQVRLLTRLLQMIIVAIPSKPFTYTVKGTPRREAVISEYSAEITSLYQAVGETAQQQLPPPRSWRYEDNLPFTRDLVRNVMGKSLTDDENIFEAGGDRWGGFFTSYSSFWLNSYTSLRAMWIRNAICHALRTTSNVNIRSIAGNLVYEHPSISALAYWACSLVYPKPNTAPPCVDKVNEMVLTAKKYTLEFPKHVGSAANPTNDVLLITGTTGGLGAALLAEAVASSDVSRVYAVNRKSENEVSLMDRQRSSLLTRGLDPDIVESPKVIMVEADLSNPGFGVHPDVFEIVRQAQNLQ